MTEEVAILFVRRIFLRTLCAPEWAGVWREEPYWLVGGTALGGSFGRQLYPFAPTVISVGRFTASAVCSVAYSLEPCVSYQS